MGKRMDMLKDTLPIYVGIKEAANRTGMSTYYLRGGIASGKIAHIRSGNRVFINFPLLIATLEEEAKEGLKN